MADHVRPPEKIVAALQSLKPPVDLDHVVAPLRELALALAGQDPLTLGKFREAAVEALQGKIRAPARLVDSAFALLRGDSGQNLPQGDAVDLVAPEPCAEEVDGAELLGQLAAMVRRFIVVGHHEIVAVALWIVHTHALLAAWITPRLAVTSPTKRCGKSLLLDVLEHLAAKALNVANVTAAAVFRGIEQYQPTLLIDEADTFLSFREELRGILNSGHRRNGRVLRAVGETGDVRAFSTFAPVAIAMIGRLPDTLADRGIPIAMRRKARGEHVEPFRADRVGDLEVLRNKTARWALDHLAELQEADPEVPPQLHDREADNWRALLAIADAAGGEWPETARKAARALSVAGRPSDDDAPGVVLLGDLRAIFEAEEAPTLFTDRLLVKLHELQDRRWAEWRNDRPLTSVQLAALLRPFGVQPRQIRIGGKSTKGYERQAFEDAFSRYLPPLDPKHPKQVNGDKDLRETSTRNMDPRVSGRGEPKTPVSTGVVSGVSGRNPASGAMPPPGSSEEPPDDKVEL